ncbi:hypothetical protein H6F96_19430 [Microcoleus sp. FACHB-53]|nr:hypothetical protein [Microcoleus sp. FACHB-53]
MPINKSQPISRAIALHNRGAICETLFLLCYHTNANALTPSLYRNK